MPIFPQRLAAEVTKPSGFTLTLKPLQRQPARRNKRGPGRETVVSLVVKSRKTLFHGELVKRVTAHVLLVLLGLTLSVPAIADSDSTAAQRAAQKNAQKKAQKQSQKQSKKSLKQQKKAQKTAQKSRDKAVKAQETPHPPDQ